MSICLYRSLRNFAIKEDGPTAVEYAFMLALIVAVCLMSIKAVGTNTNASFQRASTQIQSASS